jgi:hypothetical protein
LSKRRPITDGMKWRVVSRQANVEFTCPLCHGDMHICWAEFDHHLALIDGGKHKTDNLRAICSNCHREKSAREHIANCKAKRLANPKPSKHPMKGSGRKIPAHVNPWGKR